MTAHAVAEPDKKSHVQWKLELLWDIRTLACYNLYKKATWAAKDAVEIRWQAEEGPK